MNDALTLIGFYFTLIGFVSGLFFTRLDSWYGSVRQFHGKLLTISKRDGFENAKSEVQGLIASEPTGSYVGVGLMVFALVILGFFVPVQNPVVNPILFLYAPMVVTVLAYWIGGIVLINKATSLLKDSQSCIQKGLSG